MAELNWIYTLHSLVRHKVEKHSSKNKLSHFSGCFLSVELLSEHLLMENSDCSPSFTFRRRWASNLQVTVPLTSKMAASVICSIGRLTLTARRENGFSIRWGNAADSSHQSQSSGSYVTVTITRRARVKRPVENKVLLRLHALLQRWALTRPLHTAAETVNLPEDITIPSWRVWRWYSLLTLRLWDNSELPFPPPSRWCCSVSNTRGIFAL